MTLGPLKSFLQHSEDLFSALYGLFAISGAGMDTFKKKDIYFSI